MRRLYVFCLDGALVSTGCLGAVSPESAMESFDAGRWSSEDGEYYVDFSDDGAGGEFRLPFDLMSALPVACNGAAPGATAGDFDSWWLSEDSWGTGRVTLVRPGVSNDIAQAQRGDWSALVVYPCGVDYRPLELTRRDGHSDANGSPSS